IYRNVGAFVGLDVSPEVRGVFDRMLAGEAEIAYARQYYDDLKTLSAPEGATEAQKRDIDRKAALARTTSEERHIARMVREYLQAEGNKDVGPGVMERIARLGGLDEMYVRRIHGDEAAAWLREQYGDRIFRRKGGDYGALVVAERLGYDSVRTMLEDVAEAQSYRDAVNAATDRMVYEAEARIRAAMLEDAPTPADADYHSDEYSDVFAAKQRVLDALAAEQAEREGRRAGRMMTDRAIRTAAYENNARKKQKKAVQYHSEVEAFKRHAGNAARAEAKGDNIKAAEEYRLMRMAHYGIKAALEARRELDRKLNSGEL
ncbi:MAG: hypothetical protein LBT97_01765, partial [Planctomycetota bacterium]|nr:hypothetical protein [Planctomycetota bacterium]